MSRRTIKHLLMLPLAALLVVPLAAFSTATAEPPEPDGAPERTLRAMTYNIAHGRGLDGDVSLHRIAHVIRETGAEVIALQEVDKHWSTRSDFRDQLDELAQMLDMHAFYGPIYSFPPDYDPEDPEGGIPHPEGLGDREYGLAILSAHPIVQAENHEITRFARRGEPPFEPKLWPGFPEAVVNVQGAHVRVFSTHLQAGMEDVRETQVDDMLEIVGDDDRPALLMGDLNAEPDWPDIGPLFETFDDVWPIAGSGDGYTFRADDPFRRIDYILVSPGVEVEHAEVIESDASDHFGVVADLTIPR